MMPILRGLSCLTAVLLLSLTACTTPPQPTGSVQFAASVQQALSASDVTRVKLTVSASDMSSLVVELAKANVTWGGLIGNIPAGSNRTFLAEAFDSSGTRRFQGQTSGVTINANQTTAVAITLQELAPPPPYGNEAPLIESVVASPTSVQTGGSVSLNATVRDPNSGDTLTYLWSASGGSFSTPTAATTSWTAPSSTGIQTLTLTVTDTQGAAVAISLAINVFAGVATGNAAVNISFNLWPVVSKVSASRNRLDAGQSTSVLANASDADGDPLSYQWTATCPGTWTSATSSSASFVPSSVPAGACNNCRLNVTVQDGRGGQTTGSLNLCIATSSTERFPPSFTNSYQSTTATAPGQTVTFDVTAMDAQSSTLSFSWNANMGSLAVAQNTPSTSRIVWTAPSCTVTSVTPTVTAVVSNAYGLSASKPFSLSGLPVCASGWTPTAAMGTGRSFHTTTPLPSGKVLVTGGYNGSPLNSVALYDSAANTWSTATPMGTARHQHTATLLPSGKVLVTGGGVASAEVYDPVTNTWSSAGSMGTGRAGHTATLLNSGKVLVMGGSSLTSAEVYNPATNAWSSAGSMSTIRHTHTATLLNSGKVLVTGGNNGGPLNSAEVYDPATSSWSSASSMSTPRTNHTATLLPSGKVLILGGVNGEDYDPDTMDSYTTYSGTAALYDPVTNAWSSESSIGTPRAYHTATLLPSGKVLVTGGRHDGGNLNAAALYDPATNAWSSAGSLGTPRAHHTATLHSSGRVLIIGGYHGSPLTSTETYTP